MTRIVRGQTLSFGVTPDDLRHEEKGAVAIGDDGTILWSGPISLLPRGFAAVPVDDYGDCLVMPGFIDAHIHFPQYRMSANRPSIPAPSPACRQSTIRPQSRARH